MLLRTKINIVKMILELIIIVLFLIFFIKYHYIINIKYVNPDYLDILKLHYKAIILISSFWLLLLNNFNFLANKDARFSRQIGLLLKVYLPFSLFFFTISSIKSEDLLSVNLSILYLSLTFIIIVFIKLFFYNLLYLFHKRGKYIINSIIIGNNENVIRFIEILEKRKDLGINIIKKFEIQNLNNCEYEKFLILNNVKIIYISQGSLNHDFDNRNLINFALKNNIDIYYLPYTLEGKFLNFSVSYLDVMPIYTLKKYPLDFFENKLFKRCFDFIFATFICLLLLSWLVPIIALLIKLDSKGDIFFRQKRRGLNGEIFNCYKFRTMRNDGTNSIKSTIVNDSRITRLGNFLRKTSIDELPQFFNVLKGDMSIVGPRPHMVLQDDHYGEIINKYNLRHCVKPGITGYAQVKGYRGPINNDKDMEYRIIADIYYVRNWSLLFDIQIIYQTIVLVFKGDKNAI